MAAFITSCSPGVSSDYIQPDEMEDILYDYHLAQAMADQDDYTNKAYNQTLYYHAVLNKYGVTEELFDSSLHYYYTHAEQFAEMYGHISKRLEDEALRLGTSVGASNKYSQYDQTGDTANIWTETMSMVLSPMSPYNKYTFVLETDSTYKVGDTFLFLFDAAFLSKGGMMDCNAYLLLKYANDSVAAFNNKISRNGSLQLRAKSDEEKALSEIRGFIYLDQADTKEELRVALLNQIQLIRFHKVEETSEVESETIVKESSPIGNQEVPTIRKVVVDKTPPIKKEGEKIPVDLPAKPLKKEIAPKMAGKPTIEKMKSLER